ncbi:hypothetical protein IAD21_05161 [Abditibacteriota bacterium]|nr:hypothetical protein IAD21_05161 [Abditibacteriota bacterium]
MLRSLSSPRWLYLGALCAVTLLFFWPYFLLDQTLYAGDTAFVFVPFRQFLTQHLAAGKIPLWNPFLFGGTPALAESQYQVFYPINWLMVLLGAGRGMGWILAIHLAFMGAGTWAFLRQGLNLSRGAALFGAIAFAFGTCIQSRLSIPVYTDAAAWLPWILWGYDRARRHGGTWFIAAPIALAFQLCTGAAQFTYYTLALLLAYHLFCLSGTRASSNRKGAAWLALGLTLVLGVTLSMSQLIPEFELARLSNRGTSATYEFAISGSLSPRHFALTSLFPKFFGLYGAAPLDGFLTSTESGYLGAIALALLGAATAFPRRAIFWFWAGCALVSLSLAFGGHNPLYPLLFRFLPGTSTFRGPGNWLLITSFCGTTLAAMGLHVVLEGNAAARLRAFALGLCLFVVSLVIVLSPLGAAAATAPQKPYGPWGQVALFAIIAALLALIWKTPRALSPLLNTRRIGGAVLVILLCDLYCVSQDMELNQTILSSDLEVVPPTIERLKSVNAALAPERFWSDDADTPLEPWQAGRTSAPDELSLFRSRQGLAMRSLMPSCVAAEWGVPGLTGAWGALMPLRRHPQPIYEAGGVNTLKLRWWRLLGTRYHISFKPPTQSEWTTISSEQPAIYRDPQTLPRAFWVEGVEPTTPDSALTIVNSTGFNPRRQVALESDTPIASAKVPRDLRAAKFTRYEETRLELTINAPADGQLVLMDTFFPGWKARVDGRDELIRPANFVGRAVSVTAGAHRIEMWFEPASVRLGIFFSLVTLSLLSAIASASWNAGRQKKCSTKEKSL